MAIAAAASGGYQVASPSQPQPTASAGLPMTTLSSESPLVFETSGWHFEAESRPLWGNDRVDELRRERQLSGCDGMPDMFCGDSAVRFRHAASGTVLDLSACDAFRCCSWRPPPPAAMQPASSSTAQVEACGPLLGSVRCQFADRWKPPSDNPDVKEMEITSDWTCSTAYWGSFRRSHASPEEAGQETLEDDVSVVETDEPLPMDLLQRRDDILWYQEVLFWEGELSDCGLCRVSVKVRVMPTFWFALMLCELRVDNVLLREVATRFFCSFGADKILREWTWKEATYEELRCRGVVLADNPLISAESVGTSLLGPRDVKRQLRHTIRLGG